MAQIVLIAAGTYREGINNMGDIVAIHDDDVILTGKGYEGFGIVAVKGMTGQEVWAKIQSLEPPVKTAFRTKVAAETWTLDRFEEKQVWQDGDTWRDLAKVPKYQFNLALLGDTDIADLNSELGSVASKAITLELKTIVNLKELEVNKVEVADLNKAEVIEP